MAAPLDRLGLATEAVELPTCGPAGGDRPLGDLDAAAAGAVARAGRRPPAVLGGRVGAAGWRRVPGAAVVCARDRATRPERQRRWAARAGTVVELGSGHHPFLSRPDELAELITRAAP